MKDVLVSFASAGRENYRSKLLHLIDSAIQHWHGDILVYSPDHWLEEYNSVKIHAGWPPGSKHHLEMPYQFKIALIRHARNLGYERIVWLDTSMVIANDLRPLFGNTGITVFENEGHPLKNYISDHALSMLAIWYPNILNMPQIWGGAILFDFTKSNCNHVFELIENYSMSGIFKDGGSARPGFVAHRHDQAVISVIVNGRCDMLPYGKIVSRMHAKSKEYGDDIYLVYE